MFNSKNNTIPLHLYTTFSISIFLGAFLLFQIQPIISKYILPWFGGASAVWITAILFFQTLLLLGYLYVYLLSFLSLKKQTILHGLIIVSASIATILILKNNHIPVLPGIESKLNANYSPIIQVLWILFLGTGITYFLLSTTSILLQKWYGITFHGKSPYIFYSLSNLASLLALLTYPVLVEPFFHLASQGTIWSIGFIIYGILMLICCIQIFLLNFKKHHLQPGLKKEAISNKIGKRKIALWIFLPALSSLMLLSTTNLLTQSVASVPFLWLIPLSIYLISFIFAFGGNKWYKRNLYAYVSLLSGFLCIVFIFSNIPTVIIGIIIYSLMLFSACMLCHGELYQIRPESQHLDLYYLLLSFGSALSGIFVGIIAPLFFNGIWEIYIGFYLTFILTVWTLLYYKNSFLYRHIRLIFLSDKEAFIFSMVAFPLTILGMFVLLNLLSGNNITSIKTWRSFYGVIMVKHNTSLNSNVLVYGNIVHGNQFMGKHKNEPTTYYGKKSGIGIVLKNSPVFHRKINIGVIGLGTGTMATYGKIGDTVTFFDINPQIIQIARNNFTFLQDSKASIHITEGDGRLSLEKEILQNKQKYDLIVIDAFSDDSIPVHLLTKEAFDVYRKRLNPEKGIIAIHISNRYIDLKPVLYKIGNYYKMKYASFYNQKTDLYNSASEWVLLTNDDTLFKIPAISKSISNKNKKLKDISLWTDNYSNLFQVLK